MRRFDGSGSEHFRLAGRNGKSERNGKSGAAALCGGTKGERVSGGAVRCRAAPCCVVRCRVVLSGAVPCGAGLLVPACGNGAVLRRCGGTGCSAGLQCWAAGWAVLRVVFPD